jgi:hypothetical protein
VFPLWSENERVILAERSMTLMSQKNPAKITLPFTSSHSINFDELNSSLPAEMKALSGKKVTVTVGSAWVRYLILPWQPNIYSKKDWAALAQNHFRERYGLKARDWDIQVSMQGYMQPVIAAALDRDLVIGLDKLAESNGWQLQVIEPSFATLVNRHRRKWKDNDWLLIVENDRLLLAESNKGVWQRFRVMLSTAETLGKSALMLVQQARQFNSEPGKKQLFLFTSNSHLTQDFIEDMEVQLISENWLDALEEGHQ